MAYDEMLAARVRDRVKKSCRSRREEDVWRGGIFAERKHGLWSE